MNKNVVVIEDNAAKAQEIERALKARLPVDVYTTPSIAQAYRLLQNKDWDLVILDMTFQVSQSGTREIAKSALAGIEILQFMARRQFAPPVIVATQHTMFTTPGLPGVDSIDRLHSLLARLFPKNYRATVRVDLSEESWKAVLQSAAADALGSKFL